MSKLSIELYRKLYLARRSEEQIIRLYPQDDMKTPMHMSFGQEAIPVGVCQALGLENQIWTSYRSHAAFLAKTQDTDKFFAELYGKESGTASGKAGSMHLADPAKGHMMASAVVASVIPAAVGMAFANKRAHNNLISCVFFGDGALDEGVFWESLNVACSMKLPVMFICEDNGFAVHTPNSVRQGYESATGVIERFNCIVRNNDTNDVESIHSLTKQVMAAMIADSKPSFLQMQCYRYLEHVGINEDFDAGYRPRTEYDDWLSKDCLKLQRSRLISNGTTETEIRGIEESVEQQIAESIRLAQNAPNPRPEELYKGLFYEKN